MIDTLIKTEKEHRELLERLCTEMICFFKGDPRRIQHFIKVNSFAHIIGTSEGLSQSELFTLEAAALTHDIGIKIGEEKYGRNDGKIQEAEGPDAAQKMLESLNFPADTISRVTFLIAHHHTYDNICGIDYQILVEADFLVNFFEDNTSANGIVSAFNKIFKTNSGREICSAMYNNSFS